MATASITLAEYLAARSACRGAYDAYLAYWKSVVASGAVYELHEQRIAEMLAELDRLNKSENAMVQCLTAEDWEVIWTTWRG